MRADLDAGLLVVVAVPGGPHFICIVLLIHVGRPRSRCGARISRIDRDRSLRFTVQGVLGPRGGYPVDRTDWSQRGEFVKRPRPQHVEIIERLMLRGPDPGYVVIAWRRLRCSGQRERTDGHERQCDQDPAILIHLLVCSTEHQGRRMGHLQCRWLKKTDRLTRSALPVLALALRLSRRLISWLRQRHCPSRARRESGDPDTASRFAPSYVIASWALRPNTNLACRERRGD